MTVTWGMLLTVCPLVFLASLIDAIAGGGGLISLPAYYLAGLPPVMAAGSNKFSASFGTLIASVRYARSGKVQKKAALFAVAGALPGSWLGAEVLKITPADFVRVCLLVMIPVMAAVTLIRKSGNSDEADGVDMAPARCAVCLLIGLAIGFYDGFFGPGTGTILIILFTWIMGMGAVTASGTAKIVNLASNVAALASFGMSGGILFGLSIPAMICSVLGGFAGSGLAIRRGAKIIRPVMLMVLVLLLVKIAYDWLV